jgi:hypothetical protein
MSWCSINFRKRLFAGLALSLAATLAGAQTARADQLTLFVQQSGFGVVAIDDGGIYDIDGVVNGKITVDTPTLNTDLANAGWTVTFNDLGAISNALIGGLTTASLSQTGTMLLNAGAGPATVTIMASDINWNSPTGPALELLSSGTANFTGTTAGNSNSFQSWYNDSNVLGATQDATALLNFLSSGPNPNAHAGDNSAAYAPLVVPFGMTNQTVITLSGGTASNPAKDQFSGSTTLTAVPEPASVSLIGIGLPLTLLGLRFRRRRSA